MPDARKKLGTQIWLHHDDSTGRVTDLFETAAETGIGNVRLFLIWPWIEHDPGEWDFRVYDDAFDAAAEHDIGIKATLTANSGPWHIGTPSMLHSHTGFLTPDQRPKMREYIHQCAERYGDHEALGQWMLWNEPDGAIQRGGARTEETLAHWRRWLESEYDDLDRLNREWRTGFDSFKEIPFPEDIPNEAHGVHSWNSWQPWVADWQARADWIVEQLRWVRDTLREVDPDTEVCVNPIGLAITGNRAKAGCDGNAMAEVVDVIGGSHHPPWRYTFTNRSDVPGLVAASVGLQASLPAADRVEVSEIQTGNTYTSGNRPDDATPGEIVRFHLAGLAAGAESVTGWCFNVRSRGNEAGDWALLDDADRPSRRSRALRRVHDRLDRILEETGDWSRAEPRAWVVSDADAHCQEWLVNHLGSGNEKSGRATNDGAHGALLLAVELMGRGAPTTVSRLADVPTDPDPGDLVVTSHQVAWDADGAARLLDFADAGGTLLLDGTTGRFDPGTGLHRPWPGGLGQAIGLRGVELASAGGGYDTRLHGTPAGRFPLVRARTDTADAWTAWSTLRYEDDAPAVRERPFGEGRVVHVASPLGPALLHGDCHLGVRHVLNHVAPDTESPTPVADGRRTLGLPVETDVGRLTLLVRTDVDEGSGQVSVDCSGATYRDAWADATHEPDGGDLTLAAEDGVALLREV